MSRDDFVTTWKYILGGLALFGVVRETKDGTLTRTARMFELPDEIEGLLGKMYDSLKNIEVVMPQLTIEQMVAEFMDAYNRLTVAEHPEVKKQLRTALGYDKPTETK